jgi:peroxiredoxin
MDMKINKKLNFNDLAPDLELLDIKSRKVKLSSLWAKKPLVLAFTRHFGCTQCKEMLAELVEGRAQIKKAGLDIAVISQGVPDETALFAQKFAPGLKVLCDPERDVYHAYGLERGGLFQTFLNLKVWRAVARSRRKGYAVEQPPEGQDAMQMSGTFIISPSGHILLPFYYDHIADHPSLQLLISGVLSTPWQHEFEGPVGSGKAGRQ